MGSHGSNLSVDQILRPSKFDERGREGGEVKEKRSLLLKVTGVDW